MSNDTKKPTNTPTTNTLKKLSLDEALDAVRAAKQERGDRLEVGLVRDALVTRDASTGEWTLVGDISGVHPGRLDAGIGEIMEVTREELVIEDFTTTAAGPDGGIPDELLAKIREAAGTGADVRIIAAPAGRAKDIIAALQRGEAPEGGFELPPELVQGLFGNAAGGTSGPRARPPTGADIVKLDAMLDAAGVPPDGAEVKAAADDGDDEGETGDTGAVSDADSEEIDSDAPLDATPALANKFARLAHWVIMSKVGLDPSAPHLPALPDAKGHACGESCFRAAAAGIAALGEAMLNDKGQTWMHADPGIMHTFTGVQVPGEIPVGLISWIAAAVRGGKGACNCAKCVWMRMLGADVLTLSPDGKQVLAVHRTPREVGRALGVFSLVARFGPERGGPCKLGDPTWESPIGRVVPVANHEYLRALDAAQDITRAKARAEGTPMADARVASAAILQRPPKEVQ